MEQNFPALINHSLSNALPTQGTPNAMVFADELLIGTANANKLQEYRRLAKRAGLVGPDASVLGWNDLCAGLVVEESGETLLENARAKGQAAAEVAKRWTIADDTGLFVPLLGGAPGIRSGRYAGENATAADNRTKLLQTLRQHEEFRRQAATPAEFRCHMVLFDPNANLFAEAVGVCRGWIVAEPAGRGGFGYDSLFWIRELHRTLAESSSVGTDMIGHRGRAFHRLCHSINHGLTTD